MAPRYEDERLDLPQQYVPGKIGVVTVLYNSETVLQDFFESIACQEYRDFVVYCVDNASSDLSESIPLFCSLCSYRHKARL